MKLFKNYKSVLWGGDLSVGTAEVGSRCLTHHSFGNSQRSRSHPGRCTVRPRVALSSGERGGSVSTLCLVGGTKVMSIFMSDINVPCRPSNNGKSYYEEMRTVDNHGVFIPPFFWHPFAQQGFIYLLNTQKAHFTIQGKKGRGSSTPWALCVNMPVYVACKEERTEERGRKNWEGKRTDERKWERTAEKRASRRGEWKQRCRTRGGCGCFSTHTFPG